MSRKEGQGCKEKARLVRRILESEISIGVASLEAGVEKATIRRWVAWYKAEGNEAFQAAEKYRAYSPELKRQAVEAYLAGEGSQIEIATKYHLRSDKQLRNWIKVYHARGDFNSRKYSGGGSYMKQRWETTHLNCWCCLSSNALPHHSLWSFYLLKP